LHCTAYWMHELVIHFQGQNSQAWNPWLVFWREVKCYLQVNYKVQNYVLVAIQILFQFKLPLTSRCFFGVFCVWPGSLFVLHIFLEFHDVFILYVISLYAKDYSFLGCDPMQFGRLVLH
jgi:hypothetical protein